MYAGAHSPSIRVQLPSPVWHIWLIVYKESLLYLCDNTSGRWLKIFCVFRNGLQRQGSVGYIVYGSLKKTLPFTHKKINLLRLIKGQKFQASIIRLKRESCRHDGMQLRSHENSGVLLRSRLLTRGWHIKGPALREMGRHKLMLYIKEII